jgi:hypothetical protein
MQDVHPLFGVVWKKVKKCRTFQSEVQRILKKMKKSSSWGSGFMPSVG